MMTRWLWILSSVFLVAIIVTAIELPHAMVSPGKLMAAHRDIEGKCFACHEPFRGASAARCTACHVTSAIGLRSTNGVALVSKKALVPFHQALVEQNCVACHSDHLGIVARQGARRSFAHALLKPELRSQCQNCHVAPLDQQHRGASLPCATCHQPSAWKPATFDHSKYFPLEGDHNVGCISCHSGSNTKTYSCYGCHAHEQKRMIAEHQEEGIRNIDNCVRCHTGRGLRTREGREGGDDD